MLSRRRGIWHRFLSVFLAVVLICTTGSTSWIGEAGAETEGSDSIYAAQIGDETYETLQEAITALTEAANGAEGGENTEILLLKNVEENITSTGVDYTLDMQGYTISAPEGSASRVYTISGGTVTLKNGTITGGNTSSDIGAGLAVLSGTALTAENLVITGNTQTSSVGGGMYIDASEVGMVDCTVSDNTSASDCGGILMRNGAKLTADNLTVSGNQTSGSGTWGGGISAEGSSVALCTLELKNSNIIENSAVGSGGGIYMTYTTFSATDTHIDHNTAGTNGGGIATSGTSSRNPDITFEGACTVSGNTAGTGGGIYVWTNNFYADGLVINGNTAIKSGDDAAAGLYLRATTPSTNPGNVVLKNVEISDNVNANDRGIGGLYVIMGTGTQHYASFQMTDCRILRNQGVTCSGAYLRVHEKDGQSTELVNCEFRDNSSGDTLFLWGSTGSAGTGTRYLLSGCRIENNNASAAEKAGGISAKAAEKLVLANTVVTGNSGSATGGILGWPYFGEDSAVYGNVATDGLGANDLKIPYHGGNSIQITAMNNALSVPAASAMTDGEQSFGEYVWKDYNGYTLENGITVDILDAATEEDETAPGYFYFTAGPDITRYVAEITNSDGVTKKFEKVMDAVEAAEAGDTVKLIAGEEDNSGTMISENVRIPAGANITLDMNGRTLKSLTGQAIEIAEGGSLTLVGTEDSSVLTRYNETYTITNKGTLKIAASAVELSGIDNQGGNLELSADVCVTTVNCQGGDVILSENVQITTLNNREGSLTLSDNDQIGTLNNLAGSLDLSGNVQIGTIRHQGGNLALSENVQADTIVHQGDSLEISGNAAVANISLGAGKYVTADGGFDPAAVAFTLASTELKALNTWGETSVTLIAPAEGTVLAEGLTKKITLTGINALVVIERDITGCIVARTQELDGVFVDGAKGDDTNAGTHDAPVKTFDKAVELLSDKLTQGAETDGIYILNTITVSEDAEWSFDDALNAAGVKLMREPSFTGALISITGGAVLELSDITIDGMGKEGTIAGSALIQVNAGAKLDICDGAVLTNNYRTSGYGGAVFSDGGAIVMTGGEISGNSSCFGGGIGLDGGAFTISGGKVTGNTAEEDGGGIAVFGDAKMTLTGDGTISENTARLGGGISLGGSTTTTLGDGGATLTMTGGVIENNTSRAEGGGIYVQATCSAAISAGTISENTSKSGNFGGGGIYVNGTRSADGTVYQYGTLNLTNAVITGNSAERGGGIAGCNTSTVIIYQKNGAYIWENTANNGANQIYIESQISEPDYFISEYMPDGTPYHWSNLYGAELASASLWDAHATIYLNNTVVPETDDASVKIVNNTAANGGGGIGTNGFVQIGEPGETVDISVTKVWNDADDQDGVRPDSVKIWLLRSTDGENYERVSFLTFSDQTSDSRTETLSFKQQPLKDADGKAYMYTVEEELPAKADGSAYPYTAVITGNADNGFVITNQQVIDISGSKTWDDQDDQDGVRPESITINLYANGGFKESRTVTEKDSWSWSFTDLPKYETNGTVIVYTIGEDDVTDYTAKIDGYNVINTHTPGVTGKTVQKVWDDNNDQDGIRPDRVTVQLLANGTAYGDPVELNEENHWQYEWTGLPEKSAGQVITYTVDEISAIEGYKTSYSAGTFIITNTHTPEKVTVSGSKTWDDADDQDGIRPENIVINLYANGNYRESRTVSAENGWMWTFDGLDKYENGQLIDYTIDENAVAGYSSNVKGYDVTNTHIPETVDVSGSKTWVDNENQDGVRPDSITINLYANGTLKESKAVTEKDGWSWSFDDLPKYEKGTEITYTITENTVSGYSQKVNGYNVTNTHTPGETGRTVQKVWKDNENQDGIRPESVKVQLLADGTAYGEPVKLSEENGWRYTWSGLPEKKAGKLVEYAVKEVEEITGYTTGYSEDTFTITNTHVPETVEVKGSKTWDDANDQDGIRPTSITIRLLADKDVIRTKTVTADDNWSWSFTDLPKYENGKEIVYTIEEDAVAGYSSKVNGCDVTNTHIPETVDVSGSKTWLDSENQDGIRPESITINLYADGVFKESRSITEKDNWSWSFTDLPKYENGTENSYTITEDTVTGYTAEITGYDVINTHTPGETGRTVQKIWNDNNDQDGIRPESVKVQLFADGTAYGEPVELKAENNWSYRWSGLPEKNAGKIIVYTVKELGVTDGYTVSYSADTFIITNVHTPELVTVSGEKIWDDADDQDGIRPENIVINLYANGNYRESRTVTAGDGWTWTFDGLDKYANGQLIDYTIDENAVAGYSSNVKGYDVTNTHIPETVDVSGSKTWVDNENQDGIRPDSITINLYANGTLKESKAVTEKDGWSWSFTDLPKYENGTEISYTVTEDTVTGYTAGIAGYDVINTHTPGETGRTVQKVWKDNENQDGIRPENVKVQLFADGTAYGEPVELCAENNWSYTWSKLPEKNAGKIIVYTVKELGAADGYTVSYSEDTFTITNTHVPETVEVKGSKTWDDANDQDGIRPTSITIRLLADKDVIRTKTVTADDNWSWSFTDLPKYENGKEIVYTIEEDAVAGYSSKVNGCDVTNTHIPETVDVSGSKTWLDSENQDGIRPESITINLYANGVFKESRSITEKDNWSWSFTDLPKYENGTEISYTITEDTVTGYTAEITGYDVINTHTPGETGRTVQKIWNDNNDQDGIRPESVKVQLFADGTAYGEPVELKAENNWSYTWSELPEKNAGELVEYTVKELEEITGYTTSYSKDTFTIANTHVPETVEIKGSKTWDDADDQDGIRPENIVINLYANGNYRESRTVTAGDGWTWTFDGLDKYANGEEINYTITENPAEGYYSRVEGFDVTNTHTPETVDVSGGKTWDDADDHDGVRPEYITINLYANGRLKDNRTVTEKDGWTWSFTNLAKYGNGGTEIEYTITEEAVAGYTSEVNGYNVTNTHIPETVDIKGSDIWDDENDADGIRPDRITIELRADDVKIRTTTTTAEDDWEWSFTDLPKYDGDGNEIIYTITEEAIDGYTTEIDGNKILHVHVPEPTPEETTPEETTPEETTPEETTPEETTPEETTPEETTPEETTPEETTPEETLPEETTPEETTPEETTPEETLPEETTAPDTSEKGQLIITVLDEVTKEPVPGATVRITAPDGSVVELITGRDGRVLGDFAIGQYIVEVIDIPDGYTVTIGKTTTVTVEKNQSVEHVAEIAKNEGQVGEDETGHLPITGMLVWPVPVLSIMGILLAVIGAIDNRKRKRL